MAKKKKKHSQDSENNNGEEKSNNNEGGEKQKKEGGRGDGEKKKEEKGPMTVVVKADMQCQRCTSEIFKCVCALDGVDSVKLDISSNKLTIFGSSLDPSQIRDKLFRKAEVKSVQFVFPRIKKDKENDPNNGGDNDGGGGDNGGGEGGGDGDGDGFNGGDIAEGGGGGKMEGNIVEDMGPPGLGYGHPFRYHHPGRYEYGTRVDRCMPEAPTSLLLQTIPEKEFSQVVQKNTQIGKACVVDFDMMMTCGFELYALFDESEKRVVPQMLVSVM